MHCATTAICGYRLPTDGMGWVAVGSLADERQIWHYALVPDRAESTRARLNVEYRETHDGHIWLSSAVLLVDDADVVATLGSGDYIGLSPIDLASQSALIEPTADPSEVRLGRCSCGEAGCGEVVARCYRLRDDVVWDLFDSGNTPPVKLNSSRPSSDAIVFDAERYEEFAGRVRDLAARHPDVR